MHHRVRVYFNLHKHVWSVQRYVTGKGWRVWFHTKNVVLFDATPRVYESGRQRVLRDKKKNVHAYLEGTLGFHGDSDREYPKDNAMVDYLSYNPYKAGHFTVKGTEEKWEGGSMVGLFGRTVVTPKDWT